jgi:hypothetical protein
MKVRAQADLPQKGGRSLVDRGDGQPQEETSLGVLYGARAAGRVKNSAMIDDAAARVTAARGVLQTARDNLDEAVAALPDGEDDNTMVTPGLLALLLRVVEARRQVTGLEVLLDETGAP